MADRRNRFGTIFFGMFIGGVIGAIVMLLAAPQSGEQTRAMIRDKGDVIKKEISSKVQDTRDRAGMLVTQVRDQGGQLAQRMNPRSHQFTEFTVEKSTDLAE